MTTFSSETSDPKYLVLNKYGHHVLTPLSQPATFTNEAIAKSFARQHRCRVVKIMTVRTEETILDCTEKREEQAHVGTAGQH